MKKNKLFIANWKMNLSFEQSINFITSHLAPLSNLALQENTQIILCPSFTEIYPTIQILKNSSVLVGAQNCSSHIKGAFTGGVSAVNLNEIGCKYCIIGHSESRKYYNETNEQIAQKLVNLIDYGINPIICVGEEKTEFEKGQTIQALEKQLNPTFERLKSIPNIDESLEICLAYEPIWSIGTGKTPEIDHLETIFAWLCKITQKTSTSLTFKLLYGGSVSSNNIKNFMKINDICGFLIGGASSNFPEFEKIINLAILD